MTLDNEKISVLLDRYLRGEKNILPLLRKEVEVFVYHFPRVVYRADEDDCGDFYLYMFERLDSVWEKWNPHLSHNFGAWFVAVLRHRYLDFLRWRKKPLPPSPFIAEDYAIPLIDHERCGWEQFRLVLHELVPHDRLWILWFYLPEEISPEDMLLTKTLTGKSYLELLDIQKALIAEKLKDIERIRSLSERLSSLFDSIREMKLLMRNLQEKTPENLRRLMKLESMRERILSSLYRVNRSFFTIFGQLFTKPREAKLRLGIAESHLRLLLLQKQKGDTDVLFQI